VIRHPSLWAVFCLAAAAVAADVHFGFEQDLGGWAILEGGFGAFRCGRDVYHHYGGAYRKEGRFFLSTLESPEGRPDDAYTGVAESPVFRLEGPSLRFMVGGGNHPNTYVALCLLDGREVRRGQGVCDQKMVDVEWDVREFAGQQALLRVADGHTGGWGHVTLDDVRLQGTLEGEATARYRASRSALLPTLLAMTPPRPAEPPRQLPSSGDPASLRAAIRDLAATFGERYPDGDHLLAELAALEPRLAAADAAAQATARAGFEALQKRALTANPLVCGQPILFVVRNQYKPDHHNTETMFQTDTVNSGSYQGGGALKTIDFGAGPEGRVAVLLDAGAEGVARDPDVHFSGRRLVFAMRRSVADNYHLYEVGADGGGLRQLTAAAGITDIDPLYLPDDRIAFTSTREPKFCMCNIHIMGNLFCMDADGANVHQIGKSTLHEGHGSLTPDGRILYDRWEYVDRNFGDAQGLWTVNPDGTNHALFWGNNTNSPGGVLDPRLIAGTQRVVSTFGSCHDRPWGAIAIVDRRRATDGREAVVHIWPASAIDLVGHGDFDTFTRVWPRYEDPYPLGEAALTGMPATAGRYFLCSRMAGHGEQMGIVLLDVFGNEVLLHSEVPGCFDPMPLAPRACPPAIPSRRQPAGGTGVMYVSDVYRGTHLAGVERGQVRFLRVVESPEKRYWTAPAWGGQGVHRPAMNWHSFENKRILGTVPVAADGSACFEVPAETFVYFQVLDENGMMVQSMRSGTMVQPGEVTGCVGCHEARQRAPAAGKLAPVAAAGAPAQLTGWYGPPRLFSFLDEVQPVLDRHCAGCHDFGKPAGEKLLLVRDRAETFNAAYTELWRTRAIAAIGAGPAETQQARSWGSHASKLVKVLRQGHQKIELSSEEFDRIVTWIDINAPYYPTYASAFPDNLTGRCPIDPGGMQRLTELTGIPFSDLASFHASRGPQISFDRPEISPCLKGLASGPAAALEEALAIIRRGAQALAATPRGDSTAEGIAMCPTDRQREEFYQARRAAETEVRRALASGGQVYDPGLPAQTR
jgi:hypothetical protein